MDAHPAHLWLLDHCLVPRPMLHVGHGCCRAFLLPLVSLLLGALDLAGHGRARRHSLHGSSDERSRRQRSLAQTEQSVQDANRSEGDLSYASTRTASRSSRTKRRRKDHLGQCHVWPYCAYTRRGFLIRQVGTK